MREKRIQDEILIALNGIYLSGRFWRNETGVYMTRDGRWVTAGLCRGSSDIIGLVDGRFVAIEVKSKIGRVSSDQQRFIDIVIESGGIAGVARSIDEAVAIVEGGRVVR